MGIQTISVTKIREAFQRSLLLINRDLTVKENEAGWHQFVGEGKIGVVGTALGLVCLKHFNIKSPYNKKIIAALLNRQVVDGRSSEFGGWCLLSSDGMTTVEATAWALLGLSIEADSTVATALDRGLRWIKKNQNGDGGWGGRLGLSSRTYPTFIACRSLITLEPYAVRQNLDIVSHAKEWVLRRQQPDGGWGNGVEDRSAPVHTAFALLTLISLGHSVGSDAVRSGIDYLLLHWRPHDFWETSESLEQYEIPKNESRWTRITFQYFPTAWCLIALVECRLPFYRRELADALKWLIDSQLPDGSWVLKTVAKTRLWIIHDAVYALTRYVDGALSVDTPFEILCTKRGAWICDKTDRPTLVRGVGLLLLFFVAVCLTLGIMAGGILHVAAPSIKLWAWFLFCSIMCIACLLAKYNVISWRDALLVTLIPGLLLVLQIFMGR